MRRLTIAFIGWLVSLPVLAATDLSGVWTSDDGGRYYLRQSGQRLVWFGEERATDPHWSNVFVGRVNGDAVKGSWQDVPKGSAQGRGEMELRIRANGNVLNAVRKTGGFGASRWTRVTVQEAVAPPQAPIKPIKPLLVAPAAEGAPSEDCLGFDPRTARAAQVQGRWKIVDGDHWLFDFGNNGEEVRTAYRVIRHYQLDHSCFVGRPDPSFTYLLRGDRAPQGRLKGEDCVGFDPQRAQVAHIDGHWKIVDGNHWMFDFAGRDDEAKKALAIIRKYGFTQSCFVGRPQPSFSYLRR